MMLVAQKGDERPFFMNNGMSLIFWRAFRSHLWANGEKRDPKVGDEMHGIRILSISF